MRRAGVQSFNRKETKSPTSDPIPAPTTASMSLLATAGYFPSGLLAGLTDDVDFVAGLHEFQALADLQFLFGGIIDRAG